MSVMKLGLKKSEIQSSVNKESAPVIDVFIKLDPRYLQKRLATSLNDPYY